MKTDRQIMDAALAMARAEGATVAGFVPANRLVDCPSAVAEGRRGFHTARGSFIVLGLYHDPGRPELDLWEEGRGTPGDRMLGRIAAAVSRWLAEEHGREAHTVPYRIEDGGIYLKDAAVFAGLGVIGRNNLVIVPGYGPRIRFRAVWTDLEPGDADRPIPESPCERCTGRCQRACPQNAFFDGRYRRDACMRRMETDKSVAARRGSSADHCRVCELVCPAE
jgi:epoxyqueuosine reductase